MALLAHWPLRGNLKDYSGNGIDLLRSEDSGAIVVSTSRVMGWCYERPTINNGKDYLYSSKSFNLDKDFTLAFWVYSTEGAHDTTSGLINFFKHNTFEGLSFDLSSSNRISFDAGYGTKRSSVLTGVQDIMDKWAHITITYDRSKTELNFYKDGILEDTKISDFVPIDIPIELFSWSSDHNHVNTYRAAAKLNDVRVYDNIISLKEIKELSLAKILHYPLSNPYLEKATKILDISGYDNHGTPSTNYIYSKNSPLDEGSLSGTISTPNIFGDNLNQTWTTAAWVKVITPIAGMQLNNFNSGNSIIHSVSNNKALLYINSGVNDSYTYSNTSVPVGEWFHIAFVLNSDTRRCQIYINGELNGTSSNYSNTAEARGYISSLIFGTNTSEGRAFYKDVRIYGTDLSEEDIRSLYQNKASFDDKGNIFSYGVNQNEEGPFKVNEDGIINNNTINQIDYEWDENDKQKQRIREDGSVEMTGFIIQN